MRKLAKWEMVRRLRRLQGEILETEMRLKMCDDCPPVLLAAVQAAGRNVLRGILQIDQRNIDRDRRHHAQSDP